MRESSFFLSGANDLDNIKVSKTVFIYKKSIINLEFFHIQFKKISQVFVIKEITQCVGPVLATQTTLTVVCGGSIPPGSRHWVQ